MTWWQEAQQWALQTIDSMVCILHCIMYMHCNKHPKTNTNKYLKDVPSMIAKHLFIYFVLKRLNFHELWYIRCNPPGHVYLRLDAALLGDVLPALLHDGHKLGVGRDVETGVREIGLDSAEINKPLIILFFTLQSLSRTWALPCTTSPPATRTLASPPWPPRTGWGRCWSCPACRGPCRVDQSEQSIELTAANHSRVLRRQ